MDQETGADVRTRTIAASVVRLVEFIHGIHLSIAEILDPTCEYHTRTRDHVASALLRTLDSDYSAPTTYWVVIEASLAITSACLPTLRPLFHGMSPESIIRSVRSVLSLHSLRMDSSKGDGFSDLKDSNRQSPNSSTAGLNDTRNPTGNSTLTTNVTHDIPMEYMSSKPKEGVTVHKNFTVTADIV